MNPNDTTPLPHEGGQPSRYYICPNQFSDDAAIDDADVDAFIDEKNVAIAAAVKLATITAAAVTVQASINTYGDHWEDAGTLTVQKDGTVKDETF
ncbi:hypothetical protein [Agrobacterium tumefaciens]|uniref:Uncharacterized protein n=1 Tax=Agrobacterium tumefaciens TaxID=358 RepID=A0A176WWY7_AGRTU|nr:hypothetical protein [Agrobacterium tumefaciens]OAE37669.1 hypothetical protein A7J57_08815 [Agrobacterium tumefaciens]